MKITITVLLLLTLTGCSQPKIDKKAEGEKVMEISKEWADVASKGT